jgi:hypothetical protein
VKLMYAVWGAADLLDSRLRSELADAGAERLVVEVDDEAVAGAQLRLSTYDDPVHAIVSVWTEGDPQDVTDALSRRARNLAGWRVEERTPLPPPEVTAGQRVEALVNVALLRIPVGMTRDAWLERWLDHHTQVAIDTQATFGYIQNVVVEPLLEGQATVDALVEEFFPMAALTDFHAFYGSDGDDEELTRRMTMMLESVATFGAHENIDVVPTSRYELAL